MAPETRLTIDNLAYGYPGRPPLLRDLTARASAGRLTCLLGPNGSGKTTLLRLLLGQLRPSAGLISLDTDSVGSISERERACRMAYVPQHTSLAFAHSLGEVVAMGGWPAGGPKSDAQAELKAWSLQDLASAGWTTLSGGERQRGLLARACCQLRMRGQIMLVDEPTASMDPAWAHQTLQTLRQRAHDTGLAVVAVLHDLDLASRYADDAWLLAGGDLIASGPASHVLDEANLERAYHVRFRRLHLDQDRTAVIADPLV
ncbi:MAG: ABC transporter ATP-binding protein [Phycisphaeraceae bacterium]